MFSKKRAKWLERLRSKDIMNTKLHTAILAQRPRDVFSALKEGADPNSLHSTTHEPAIFPVCARGNIEIAKILLEAGADPNIICGKIPRIVPLVVAVIYNRTAICKILLSYGADPNGPPEADGPSILKKLEIRQEEKPVYHAARGWRISISQVLLNGDWKKIYNGNVKKSLLEVLSYFKEDLVEIILDHLGIGDMKVDISVITDEDTWNYMEEENNPTLMYFGPFNTKKNLQDISTSLEEDVVSQAITRTNNDNSVVIRESDVYGDVMKLLDESE